MVEPVAQAVPVPPAVAAGPVAHSPGSAVPEVTAEPELLIVPVVTAVQAVTPRDWCGHLVVRAAMPAPGSGRVPVEPADPVVQRVGGCWVSAGQAATAMTAGGGVSVAMAAAPPDCSATVVAEAMAVMAA